MFTNSLLFFLPGHFRHSGRFPLENELEGANREVLQYVEILAALGHDIRFVSFSSKVPEFAAELRTARGAIDREKYDFLMGSFNMSGVSLLERTERLRVSQPPVNGNDLILASIPSLSCSILSNFFHYIHPMPMICEQASCHSSPSELYGKFC